MYCKKVVQFVLVACVCFMASNSCLVAEDIDYFVDGDLSINGYWDDPDMPTDYDFVNFLPEAETSGLIMLNEGGEVHMYGGVFNHSLWEEGFFEMTVVDAPVTIHGTKFWVGGLLDSNGELVVGELIEEDTDYINLYENYVPAYPCTSYESFNIAWEHHDGTIYNVWIGTGHDIPVNLSSAPFQDPIQDPVQATIDFLIQSVADGMITGYTPSGNEAIADRRIVILRDMLIEVGILIESGDTDIALEQLEDIARRTDGEKNPPDFVIGDSVAELNQMVDDMIAALSQ